VLGSLEAPTFAGIYEVNVVSMITLTKLFAFSMSSHRHRDFQVICDDTTALMAMKCVCILLFKKNLSDFSQLFASKILPNQKSNRRGNLLLTLPLRAIPRNDFFLTNSCHK
jgi:hypothetical protein